MPEETYVRHQGCRTKRSSPEVRRLAWNWVLLPRVSWTRGGLAPAAARTSSPQPAGASFATSEVARTMAGH